MENKNLKPVILLVGPSGSGKSSLINKISGNEVAKVSNYEAGTSEWSSYETDDFILFDSVGYELDSTEEFKEEFKKFKSEYEDYVIWYCIPITRGKIDRIDEDFLQNNRAMVVYTKFDEDDENDTVSNSFNKILNIEGYRVSIEDFEGNEYSKLLEDSIENYKKVVEFNEEIFKEILMNKIMDDDLKFLADLTSEELQPFAETVLFSDVKNKTPRFTTFPETDKLIDQYDDDYRMYIGDIVTEYIAFGGNTFSNMFYYRTYEEILDDVLKNFKVEYKDHEYVKEKEDKLIFKVLEEMLKSDKGNEILNDLENIDEIKEEILKHGQGFKIDSKTILILIRQIIKSQGFLPYMITVIVANYVSKVIFKRGLSFATNATLTKALSYALSGPLSVALWTWQIWDIASPAKRVIVPATIFIAFLRRVGENKNVR